MRKTFPKGFVFMDDQGHNFKCISDLGDKGIALENDSGELTIIAKSCVTVQKTYLVDLK